MWRHGCKLICRRSSIKIWIDGVYGLLIHLHRLIKQNLLGRHCLFSCFTCFQYFMFVLYFLMCGTFRTNCLVFFLITVLICLVVFSKLILNFIHYQIATVSLLKLFNHTLIPPSLIITVIIAIFMSEMILYISSVGRRICTKRVLAMMMLMKNIMTMSHYPWIFLGSYYSSSQSLIYIRIMASTFENDFPRPLPFLFWKFLSFILTFLGLLI